MTCNVKKLRLILLVLLEYTNTEELHVKIHVHKLFYCDVNVNMYYPDMYFPMGRRKKFLTFLLE